MTQWDELNLERDLHLDAEDQAALDRAHERRIDPSEMRWEWISLARQFPHLRQSREIAAGREPFRLLID